MAGWVPVSHRRWTPHQSDTIQRLLYYMEFFPADSLQMAGFDDWAWLKELRYGTIEYELETVRPV